MCVKLVDDIFHNSNFIFWPPHQNADKVGSLRIYWINAENCIYESDDRSKFERYLVFVIVDKFWGYV